MFYNKQRRAIHPAADSPLFNREVEIHLNLLNGLWTVGAVKGNDGRGIVQAYADECVLTKCRGVVSEAGRQRIIHRGQREVVAWFIGIIDPTAVFEPRYRARVTFHPFEQPWFFNDYTEEPVWYADEILFAKGGKAWMPWS